MAEISFDDFTKVDIRLGRIVDAAPYPEARKPAIKLWIDFGAELGVKKSSAQITQHYAPDQLFGKQILAVVNFPPRQIGRFMSEVLVLGVSGDDGGDRRRRVILLRARAVATAGLGQGWPFRRQSQPRGPFRVAAL